MTPDGHGGSVETWATVATVWAEVKPMSAAERYFGERLEENVTHKVRIRYRDGINSAMRIAYKGRVLKIKGIMDVDERGRWLDLQCEEGAGS